MSFLSSKCANVDVADLDDRGPKTSFALTDFGLMLPSVCSGGQDCTRSESLCRFELLSSLDLLFYCRKEWLAPIANPADPHANNKCMAPKPKPHQ